MLSHLCPSGCGSASSPAVYTPPVLHTDLSLHLSPSSITTLSPPVSPAGTTWIQQVVGSLLFDARALDLSLLTAVCQLSSHQSTPTQHDLSSFCPPSPQLCLISLQPPQNHPPLFHGSLGLYRRQFPGLSRPKSGSVAGCLVGLGYPPPYLLNPPPESYRHSWKDKQSLVRASRFLQSHPSYITPPPCHPQRPSPYLLPAHTLSGSVCDRGGVCSRFWRWASVGRAHAHPNQPWPPPTVTPSPIASLITNARSVLRLPRLDRRSPSRSTCV
jgi:hypothetical protein